MRYLLIAMLLLAGCSRKQEAVTTMQDNGDPANSRPNYADAAKQQAWIDLSEKAIKDKLRDPDSAQFRNVAFHSGGGTPVVCGEVNGNNGFGGKAGYERFIAASNLLDVLESDMKSPAELDPVWAKYCVG